MSNCVTGPCPWGSTASLRRCDSRSSDGPIRHEAAPRVLGLWLLLAMMPRVSYRHHDDECKGLGQQIVREASRGGIYLARQPFLFLLLPTGCHPPKTSRRRPKLTPQAH